MRNYALKRILWTLPTLLGITLVTFFVMRLAPGDPSAALGGGTDQALTPLEYQRLAQHYGWDRPVSVQYLDWLAHAARLDFGRSFADGQRVIFKVAAALPVTIYLGTAALVLSLLISIPMGVLAARRPNGPFDSLLGLITSAGYSMPSYLMAVLLILIVGLRWDLLPFRGIVSDGFETMTAPQKLLDLSRHLLLVVFCLAYRPAAYQTRFIRAGLLDASRAPWFCAARAKGLSFARALISHGLRSTLVPLFTLIGLSLPALLSGAVILEVIFSWPGVGRLMLESVLQRDYPTVMGLAVVSAGLVLAATVAADLACAWADPRVTYD